MKQGAFIVLEGGDGAGKSTIADFLRNAFPTALMTRAGESPFGKHLRELLISDAASLATSESQFLLSFAMHLDHARNVVAPALEKGKHVISDRFDASNFAYQVRGNNAPHLESLFWDIRSKMLGEVAPDLYIFLDVSPEVGIARAKSTGKALDAFERRPSAFHTNVREGYLEFLKSVPHTIIDATRPLEEVQANVLALVKKHVRL